MENVWRSIVKSNSKYVGLYIGYEDKLFRHLPYQNKDSFVTMEYKCLREPQHFTIGYDPTCRSWYINSTLVPDTVFFTEPYEDASTGDVLISASHSVKDSTGTFIGSVSVDINMQNLSQTILSERILENGYSFLMNSDGDLIVYPDLETDRVYKVSEKEPLSSGFFIDDEDQVFYDNMDGEWLATYAKVSGTDYIVVMVVPNIDIVRAVDDIREKIKTRKDLAISLTVILPVVLFLISIYVIRIIARMIADPMKELTTVMNKINNDDLDVELGVVDSSPDVKDMFDDFGGLIKILKFANNQYLKNNVKKAFLNYQEVELMLRKLNNERGHGVALNNMALALKDLDNELENLSKYNPEYYFEKAIENSVKLGKKAKDDDGRTFYKITEANRRMNLGLYYANNGEYDKAMETYNRSLELHKECENILGATKTMGNLGILYVDINQHDKAYELLNGVYQVACEEYSDNQTQKTTEVLQYASLNMGNFYHNKQDNDNALKYINYALSLPVKIDVRFQNQCLYTLANIHKSMGNSNLYNKIMSELNIGTDKHISFVLDCSGSMSFVASGGVVPIKECRKSIVEIFTKFMDKTDSASLITFNERTNINWVFQNSVIKDNLNNMIGKVNTRTRTGGRTAFYDALIAAITAIQENSMKNKDQWIVALTDGDDNQSHSNYTHVIDKIKSKNMNIIIITAGDVSNDNQCYIQRIANSAEKGMHLHADISGIAEVFTKAMEFVSKGQGNIESF